MNKFIKIVLCALLSVAILAVPMTVMADSVNYIESKQKLIVGTENYSMNTSYEYTVFIFSPSEIGKYTITSDNLIGVVGYHWVNGNPSSDTVNSNEYVWECTSVGQNIYLAVKLVDNISTATITVVLESEEIELPIERTPYENKSDVTNFVFSGNIDTFDFIDVYDEAVDVAVLGDDGYYHLNDVAGPVIYMNLYDTEYLDLMASVSYGQMVAVVYEDDKHVATIDYNDAFTAYYNAADTETGLYPLTADLIEIYQKVGEDENHNWYGDEGWIAGSNVEDGWMFACMYDLEYTDNAGSGDSDIGDTDNNTGDNVGDNTEGGSDNNTDNNNSGTNNNGTVNNNNNNTGANSNTNGNNNANTDNGTVSPSTGDNVIAFAVAIVSTAALVLTTKKVK